MEVDCFLLAVDYSLNVVDYSQNAVDYSQSAIRYMLTVIRFFFFAICCMLKSVGGYCFAVDYLLNAVRNYKLIVVCF